MNFSHINNNSVKCRTGSLEIKEYRGECGGDGGLKSDSHLPKKFFLLLIKS